MVDGLGREYGGLIIKTHAGNFLSTETSAPHTLAHHTTATEAVGCIAAHEPASGIQER